MGFRNNLFRRGIVSSDNEVLINASFFKRQVAPATMADTGLLTAAQLLTGIIVSTPTAAAAYTLPTGALLDAALSSYMINNAAFDFSIINLSGTDGDIITLTASVGITIVGSPFVNANEWEVSFYRNVGIFRCRKTAANTFVVYRIG